LKAKRNILLLGLWKEGREVRRNPKPNSHPLAGKLREHSAINLWQEGREMHGNLIP